MSRRGWALFVAMCVLWGIPYLLIKIAVGGVSVPVVVFARTAIGALVLLPLAVRRGALPLLVRHRWPLLGFAVLEIVGPWALIAHAELRLASSLAGLLVALVPVVAVLTARVLGGAQPLGAWRWTGLGLGLGGVALLAAPDLRSGSGWAVAEMLLVAVCYAVAPILAARRLAEVPNLLLTAGCLGLAAAVYLGPAAATWPATLPAPGVLVALGTLGLACTALALVLFFELIREVGPERTMVFTYVNPAVAVGAGAVVLGEPITPPIVAAFVLILTGSVLATSGRSGPAQSGTSTPVASVKSASVGPPKARRPTGTEPGGTS